MAQLSNELANELVNQYSRSALIEIRDAMTSHSRMIFNSMKSDVQNNVSANSIMLSKAKAIHGAMEQVAFHLGTIIDHMEK